MRENWYVRLVLAPLRHPAWTMLMVGLVTVIAVLGFQQVRFEPDISRLLPQDHPNVRIASLLDDRSRPARTLWILLRGKDLDADVPKVVARMRQSPLVVDCTASQKELFAAATARARSAPLWFLPDEVVTQLDEWLSPAGRARAIEALRLDLADDPVAARELAVRDPLGVRWLLQSQDVAHQLGMRQDSDLAILADGSQALLRVTGTKDAYDAEYSTTLLEHVEGVLGARDYDAFGGYEVARADQARIRADFERSSAWAGFAILVYLCWVMRGLRLPFLVQLPAMLSIAWSVPLGSWLFGPLPTVAVAAVAVLCGLGVDFAIHYAAYYRAARLELPYREAVLQVQKKTAPELLIDMATTAVTFLAVGTSTSGGLAKFGLLLALGLVASFVVTITAFPVLLRFCGNRRDPEHSWTSSLADWWLGTRFARPLAWLLIGTAVVGGVVVAVDGGIVLRADTEALRPAGDPVSLARERIEQKLGFSTIPAALLWPQADDASPLLAELRELQHAGTVRFWSGIDAADTAAGRERVTAFRARHEHLVASTLAELSAAGLASEPFRPALEQLANSLTADPPPLAPIVIELDGVAQRVVMLWPTKRLERAAFEQLAAVLRARLGDKVQLQGTPTITAALEDLLRADLHRACLWAAVLALIMVTIWLRSLRYGLLALLPSAVGLILTMCVLKLLGVQLSLVSFVAVPFVLGIGVDEGVHLTGHFRHGASTTGVTGVGVARTSLGTVIGFGSLLSAQSPGLIALGAIVAGGSFACMMSCLFVLAPLLARRER